MASLLILSFAAAVSGAAVQAGGEPVTIVSFANDDGAKRWTMDCKAKAPDAPERIKVDPGSITEAHRDDSGCIYFKSGGKEYWVKDAAVILAGGKTATTDVCQTFKAASSSGTVEAATMGAGEKGSKARCK